MVGNGNGAPTEAAAIYDLDRTLIRRGSWVPWLRFWLIRRAPWRALLLPLLLGPALAYRFGLIERGGLKAAAHRIVMGRRVPRAVVAAVARDFAARLVAADVFAGATAALAADRSAGLRLVLATASNAYYADAIGAALGFDMVLATPSRWDAAGTLDWRPGGANNYGAEKARRLAEALAAMRPARFTSDHISDLPCFDLVVARGGEAVAANASAALRRVAQARGWRIIDWGRVAASLFERA